MDDDLEDWKEFFEQKEAAARAKDDELLRLGTHPYQRLFEELDKALAE